ncbi:MAG: type I DNA topoisomerase, partial [bacterium]
INIRGKGGLIKELKKEAAKADRVYLATDLDREGEAISWHLAQLLNLDQNLSCRLEFNEITKDAIKQCLKNPRSLDMDKVYAQQTRRILDRLVGYKISPLLWKKVKKGLSAGRVQSVAVELICEREEEIKAFKEEEYWTVLADLAKSPKGKPFQAQLVKVNGKNIKLHNEAETDDILNSLQDADYLVEAVKKSERKRNPAPPFITSTLQQEASRKLGFKAKKTMQIAQQLYEGIELGKKEVTGLITYMRTDSTRIAQTVQEEALDYIAEKYGREYVPAKPRVFKTKDSAQDAHEAIRPTGVYREPRSIQEYLSRDQYRLYKLIWERFIASQMQTAVFDSLAVEIKANDCLFKANGSTVKFPGFMVIYVEGEDDKEKEKQNILPDLEQGKLLHFRELIKQQHFTLPPPRYTEASLVKVLEERRIGRPSTYAPIIDTIQGRGYVLVEEKRLYPTELGQIVNNMLLKHFPGIMDVKFTADMEEHLDEVAEGKENWQAILNEFYQPFSLDLAEAEEQMEKIEIKDEVTDEICEKCGRNMVIKLGRYGKFLACPGFPECRNTKPILKEIGINCPVCHQPIVEKKTKRGRKFYGCSNYPDCDYLTWNKPVAEPCPKCGSMMYEGKPKKGQAPFAYCGNEECNYRKNLKRGGL